MCLLRVLFISCHHSQPTLDLSFQANMQRRPDLGQLYQGGVVCVQCYSRDVIQRGFRCGEDNWKCGFHLPQILAYSPKGLIRCHWLAKQGLTRFDIMLSPKQKNTGRSYSTSQLNLNGWKLDSEICAQNQQVKANKNEKPKPSDDCGT